MNEVVGVGELAARVKELETLHKCEILLDAGLLLYVQVNLECAKVLIFVEHF